jgi:hypothetical protein
MDLDRRVLGPAILVSCSKDSKTNSPLPAERPVRCPAKGNFVSISIMKTKLLNCALAIVLFGMALAAPAQEQPSLSIKRAAIIEVLTDPASLYTLQSSSNFSSWEDFLTFPGSGGNVQNTVAADNASFFRLRAESYPQLANLELIDGARTLNPNFSPRVYAYSYKKTNNNISFRFTFDPKVISGAALNDLPVQSGTPVSVELPDYPSLTLRLQGTNGLVSKYLLQTVPPTFPVIAVTNYVAPDAESVIIAGPRDPATGSWLLMMDNNGVPLWWKGFDPAHLTLNLRLQVNGVLSYTMYNSTNTAEAKSIVTDQFFNEMFPVDPPDTYIMDLHNFVLTKRGTCYLLALQRHTNEITLPTGPTNVSVMDMYLQELSLPDRQVLFQWQTWTNISYEHSSYPNKADYAHLNWMAEEPDGNILVSSRAASQIIKLNRQNGEVIWRLGRDGDFQFIHDPRNGFGGQHHGHRLDNGNILIFDNRDFVSTNVIVAADGPSRAVEYKLDEQAKTATLLWSYSREGFHSRSEGGAMRLPNGNTFISWGSGTPLCNTEVDPNGNIIQDIAVRTETGTDYRGYAFYKIKKSALAAAQDAPVPGPQ